MALEFLSIKQLLLIDSFLLLLVILIPLLWYIFQQVREICRNISGYVILTQLIFIVLSWVIFLGILGYYMVFRPNEQVDVFTIFLTVIVGFLGTMLGLFFSEKAFEKIIDDLKKRYKTHRDKRYESLKRISKNL